MKKIILASSVLFFIVGILILFNAKNQPVPAASQENSSQISQSLGVFLQKHQAKGEIAEAYRFAEENPQNVLSIVKCYCGCLKQGHKNNQDCFINEDGSFNLMGLNCGLCVKTALTAKQMLAEGKSVDEISIYVDSRWGKE